MEEIASSPVPQCLKTSIENVKIKMTPKAGQERSRKAETEFANYILENATLLKKLTLWLDEEEEEESSSVLEQINSHVSKLPFCRGEDRSSSMEISPRLYS